MAGRDKQSFIVRVRETVTREYVVDAHTMDEARSDFHSSDDVSDLEIVDWDVESVEENV